MAFDAGSIRASLDLDINPFQRALDQARADARAFAAGDTTARLGASADTAGASAELDKLKAKADELKGTRIDIQATADTARAQAELEALKLKADEASGRAGGAGAGGGISGLVAGGLALGPALLPAAGAVTAGLGAMLVPLSAATLGLGAFAALAIPSFQGVGKEVQTITKDQDALNAAVTQQDKLKALQQLQQDFAKIPPEQRPIVQGILDMKTALDNTAKSIQPQVFAVFTTFLKDARALLPLLIAPAREAGLALNDLGISVGKGLNSPAWYDFLSKIVPEVRPAIDAIGRSLGELIKGLGGVIEAFIPFAGGFEAGMIRITTAFANWGQHLGESQGFRTFMQWVHDNAKPVGDAIKNIADALISIVKASAGLGGVEIRLLADLAGALAAIARVPVLGPVVVDVGLLALAVGKLATAAQGLGAVKLASTLLGIGGSGKVAAAGLAGVAPEIAAVAGALVLGGLSAFNFNKNLNETKNQSGITHDALIALEGVGVAIVSPFAAAAIAGKFLADKLLEQGQSAEKANAQDRTLTNTLVSGVGAFHQHGEAAKTWADTMNQIGQRAAAGMKITVDHIEQAIGILPPDLANTAQQAMTGMTTALQRGQAPGQASIDAQQIVDAFNQLNKIPGLGQQAMSLLKSTIDSYGKQIDQTTEANVTTVVNNYAQLPPNIQQQAVQAMAELNAGLATGNQQAINDSKAKLAILTGNYAAFANDAGVQGTSAGHQFTSNLIAQMDSGLGTLQQAMAAYDAALAQGINPLLASIGAKTFGPGSQVPFFGTPRATGGMLVDHPMFVVGEEAPKYPEVVISTNPAYRTRNVGLLGQATQMMGLQTGGFMDPSQVPPPPSAQLLSHGSVPLSFGSATNLDAMDEFNKVKDWVTQQAAARAAVSSSGGDPFGGGPIKAYMLGEVAKRWPGEAEAAAFDYVEMREAGYNPNAQNPTSSAAGLAQNISGFGPGYERGNVQQQTAWMLNYIAGRYGDPIGAAAHERSAGWYGNGGIFNSPTIIGVGEKGPEAVVPLGRGGAFGGGQQVVNIDASVTINGNASPQTVSAHQAIATQTFEAIRSELAARQVVPSARLPG